MLGVRHQTRTNENEATSKPPNLGRVGKVASSPAPISPGGHKKRGLVDVTNRGKGISDVITNTNKRSQVLKGPVSSPVQKHHGVPSLVQKPHGLSEAVKVYSEVIHGELECSAGRLGDEEDALVEAKLRQTDLGLSNRIKVVKGTVQHFLFPADDNSGKCFKRVNTTTRMEKIRDLSK